MKIGLISDTHGLVKPEALRALAGVERQRVEAGKFGIGHGALGRRRILAKASRKSGGPLARLSRAAAPFLFSLGLSNSP